MRLPASAMASVRAFFFGHQRLALLLVALVLCMKAFVPTGYMVGLQDKTLSVYVCSDATGTMQSKTITIPMEHGSKPAASKGECAFSSLSLGALAGADLPLLAIALAYILALGFASSAAPLVREIPYLRPHLRGPPSAA